MIPEEFVYSELLVVAEVVLAQERLSLLVTAVETGPGGRVDEDVEEIDMLLIRR